MIFNSISFIVFFVVFYSLFLLLKDRKHKMFLFLIGSYFFYGWWDWRFLFLILFSTIIDYILGRAIFFETNESKRKRYLILSLVSNLGLLFYFKFFNFFVDSFADLLNSVGLSASHSTLNIILPVGISFYTFQTMSYTIDIYWKKLKPELNVLTFATYVVFFPQLVAGPIIRAIDLLPQFKLDRKITFALAQAGFMLVMLGFFKKVVIADSLAPLVDNGFDNPYAYSALNLIILIVLYAFQIYCDFSGYSDIAIGIGKMLGFDFPKNFNIPYISKNFSEFWQRWHISLSTWLRDYLYIPLGGSRHGKWLTQRNLMLTMLIGGLWHGANWTFVIWGGLHGTYLIVQRMVQPVTRAIERFLPKAIYSLAAILITFFFVNLAWVFFRSQSLSDALNLLGYIIDNGNYSFGAVKLKFQIIEALFLIGILFGIELLHAHGALRLKKIVYTPIGSSVTISFMMWMILLFGTFDNNNFIYFQF